jgi:small subunit ribosomal protein S4
MKVKKYKIARRLGAGIFEKNGQDVHVLTERKNAGQRKMGKRPRALSNFGMQLLEKQRVRFSYGLSESQFSNYVSKSVDQRDLPPTEILFKSLEKRLDNVVYRLGLVKTRRAARQLVSHGHIMVNGKKIRIASHQIKKGDEISVREGSHDKGVFADLEERQKSYVIQPWLEFDAKKKQGKIKGEPVLGPSVMPFNLVQIIEFYSR